MMMMMLVIIVIVMKGSKSDVDDYDDDEGLDIDFRYGALYSNCMDGLLLPDSV